MKIDGIDPLLLNKIREKIDLKEVQQAEKPSQDNRVSRDGGSGSRADAYVRDRDYEQKVDNALKHLNENVQKEGHPLRFSARKENGLWHIEVRDMDTGNLIREIPTSRALEVVGRIRGLFGVLMDEKR